MSPSTFYPTVGPITHRGTVEVTFDFVDHLSENNATETVDFYSYFKNRLLLSQLTANYTFLIPQPACSSMTCAAAGVAFITIVPDLGWEALELVRMRMLAATTTNTQGLTASVATENFVAGYVIQDECESGALFKYPDPLPVHDSQIGPTVQVATSLPNGYVPGYGGLKFEDHVTQNYPRAASEVVAETSWLEFPIALFDENAVVMRSGNPTYAIEGNLLQVNAEVEVTFKFLGEINWNAAQTPCGTLPPGWPNSWPHYAARGAVPNDFDVERFDTVSGWVTVPFNQITGESTVTIPANQPVLRMRFVAHDNDSIQSPSAIEVAHFHIVSASFPVPPPPLDAVVRVGWSSDFRFLIQDNHLCPF